MKPKELNIVPGADQRNALRAEGDLQQRGRPLKAAGEKRRSTRNLQWNGRGSKCRSAHRAGLR
jgi:hypothetical protein